MGQGHSRAPAAKTGRPLNEQADFRIRRGFGGGGRNRRRPRRPPGFPRVEPATARRGGTVMTHQRGTDAKSLISHDTRQSLLPGKLETAVDKSLDWIENVLTIPIDTTNGNLLRTQAAAATTALHTQVKANALILQAERQNRALEALIERIREISPTVPIRGESDGRVHSKGSLVEASAL